jgi:hypothetical protein
VENALLCLRVLYYLVEMNSLYMNGMRFQIFGGQQQKNMLTA